MSYVEDFLELNATLPRDFIRLTKLIREIDEKYYNSNKVLLELRKKYLSSCKEKVRNEKVENELMNQIEKEFDYLKTLSDHKIKLQEEVSYLSDFHLKKLNEIIEAYEKNIRASDLQIGLNPIPFDYKNGGMMSIMGDEISYTGSSKKRITLEKRDTYSAKSGKDSGLNVHSNFIKKKKKPSKLGRREKEEDIDDLGQTYADFNLNEYERVEVEQTYCFCNGFSNGDMIKCDNDFCKKEWFHFICVGLTEAPKGSWYCSQECKQKAKKRKR